MRGFSIKKILCGFNKTAGRAEVVSLVPRDSGYHVAPVSTNNEKCVQFFSKKFLCKKIKFLLPVDFSQLTGPLVRVPLPHPNSRFRRCLNVKKGLNCGCLLYKSCYILWLISLVYLIFIQKQRPQPLQQQQLLPVSRSKNRKMRQNISKIIIYKFSVPVFSN